MPTAVSRAPPARLPCSSNTASAPPRWAASWARTRRRRRRSSAAQASGPGAGHAAAGDFPVGLRRQDSELHPGVPPISLIMSGRKAHLRLGFRHSHRERSSGISVPQSGLSQRTVRAHR